MGAEKAKPTEQRLGGDSQYVSGCHLRDGDHRATGHSLLVVLKLPRISTDVF